MDRPILFSTPMVQAILEGRKTMTRRVIKPQPPEWIERFGYTMFTPEGHISGRGFWKGVPGDEGPGEKFFKIPYGKPGDILWVRETWRIGAWDENTGSIAVDYKVGNYARKEWIRIKDSERFEKYWIESTDDAGNAGLKLDKIGEYHWKPGEAPTRWRPSIFMPREAARIFLKVKNIRVERLQDITEEDAKAEGLYNGYHTTETSTPAGTAKQAFMWIWQKINGDESWLSNPWVWVVEFERKRFLSHGQNAIERG